MKPIISYIIPCFKSTSQDDSCAIVVVEWGVIGWHNNH